MWRILAPVNRSSQVASRGRWKDCVADGGSYTQKGGIAWDRGVEKNSSHILRRLILDTHIAKAPHLIHHTPLLLRDSSPAGKLSFDWYKPRSWRMQGSFTQEMHPSVLLLIFVLSKTALDSWVPPSIVGKKTSRKMPKTHLKPDQLDQAKTTTGLGRFKWWFAAGMAIIHVQNFILS